MTEAMDRPIPAEAIRRVKVKKVIIAAFVVSAIIISFLLFRLLIRPTLNRSEIRTSIAEIGTIEATVSASGTVNPEFEHAITSPVNSTIECILRNAGDSVKAGEPLLQLDKKLLELACGQLEDELAIQRNRKARLALELERTGGELRTAYEVKKLQAQYAQAQFDRAKHLHDIGGASNQEYEAAALNLQIVTRELEQLAQQIENQQAFTEADQREVALEIKVKEGRLNEMRRTLELADARAPRDGIVTWINDRVGAPVLPGEVIARVADLSTYRVEAAISDIHADKLRIGGTVLIRLGEVILPGHIAVVQPAVQNDIVTFMVEIADKANRSLRPNLRADVFVVTSCKEHVLRVKNGPFFTGIVEQKVFVIDGNKAVGRNVDIGASNFDWVELQGDIAPGAEVIVSDTRDFQHMDAITINDE